jgi:integrase
VQYRESTGTDDEGLVKAYLQKRIAEKRAASVGLLSFHGPQRITLAELLDNLEMNYRIQGRKSLGHAPYRLGALRRRIGGVRAAEIDPLFLRRYVTRRQEEVAKPATINRELAAIRRALNLAAEDGIVREMPRFPHLREDNARKGFFERHEVELVIRCLPDYLQDLTRFAWLTGWRKGEILNLIWDQIDMRGQAICIATSKNNHGRLLALEGELWELSQRRHESRDVHGKECPWVFHRYGQPILSMKEAWKSACQAAGVQGKVFHDLRRTAVRNLIRAAVPDKVAMDITGHRTVSVFYRYSITSEADIRSAVQRVQDYLIVRVDAQNQPTSEPLLCDFTR